MPPPRTLIDGVQLLPPGHVAKITAGDCAQYSYWDLLSCGSGSHAGDMSRKEATIRISELLMESAALMIYLADNWPDIYREQGHWLPCINLAKSLQNAQPTGHSVKFMGIPDCESIVSPYVAPAQFSNFFRTVLGDIYPRGHSVESKLEPRDQRETRSAARDVISAERPGTSRRRSATTGSLMWLWFFSSPG